MEEIEKLGEVGVTRIAVIETIQRRSRDTQSDVTGQGSGSMKPTVDLSTTRLRNFSPTFR